MASFIGPYAKNYHGGFPYFPSILNGCTSADKEEYSSGKKKGFKVSKLTMKTLPTNRYDIILELLEVHLPSIHLQIILHGRDYEITYPCY